MSVFESIAEFIDMGGYGGFVWSAYAITLFVVMANLLYTRLKHKKVVTRLLRERKIKDHASQSSDVKVAVAGSGEEA